MVQTNAFADFFSCSQLALGLPLSGFCFRLTVDLPFLYHPTEWSSTPGVEPVTTQGRSRIHNEPSQIQEYRYRCILEDNTVVGTFRSRLLYSIFNICFSWSRLLILAGRSKDFHQVQ